MHACLPLAILATRVGHTTNSLSPLMSVFHIPYYCSSVTDDPVQDFMMSIHVVLGLTPTSSVGA